MGCPTPRSLRASRFPSGRSVITSLRYCASSTCRPDHGPLLRLSRFSARPSYAIVPRRGAQRGAMRLDRSAEPGPLTWGDWHDDFPAPVAAYLRDRDLQTLVGDLLSGQEGASTG